MEKLDAIDKKIIRILQKDCSLHKKEIADQVGLSLTATYERIKRLEKSGVIEGYTAQINKEKVGKNLVAFCTVSLQLHSKPLLENFEAHISTIPEVIECFHTTGSYDYLLKIIVEDMKEYQNVLINKLSVIDNISLVQSSFVMKEIKAMSLFIS